MRFSAFPNAANYTYDPIGQVTSDLASEYLTNTTRLNEQLHYGYDAAGNLQSRTNNALVQHFEANNLNELTAETNSGTLTVMGTTTPLATNVTVDTSNAMLYGDSTFAATNMALTNTAYTALALGNGLAATNGMTVSSATSTTFQYDGNGNLTSDGLRNFAYDDENQLIQVWVTNQWQSQFVYDGMMRRRIRKEFTWQSGSWAETNEVHYVYDGNLVIQERSSNNAVLVTYTRGEDLSGSLDGAGGIGGLLARTDANGSTFYHADGNGNVTMLVNASQVPVAKYLYDAFGNPISLSGPLAEVNLYRFSTKETHPNSGMSYYLYRYYDPNLQKWLNADPLGLKGGINLYEFSGNNPVDLVDSLGLVIVCCGIDAYLQQNGITSAMYTTSGNTYSANSGASGPTSGDGLILWKMLQTSHVFTADGLSVANLKTHIAARETIVRNALGAQFSFETGHVLTTSQQQQWRDNPQSFYDSVNTPATYLSCHQAADIVFQTGNQWAHYQARPIDSIWIPGDWGRINNAAFNPTTKRGAEGENVICTGVSGQSYMFWGLPGGNKSEQDWFNAIKTGSWFSPLLPGDPVWTKTIKYPGIGLQQ